MKLKVYYKNKSSDREQELNVTVKVCSEERLDIVKRLQKDYDKIPYGVFNRVCRSNNIVFEIE